MTIQVQASEVSGGSCRSDSTVNGCTAQVTGQIVMSAVLHPSCRGDAAGEGCPLDGLFTDGAVCIVRTFLKDQVVIAELRLAPHGSTSQSTVFYLDLGILPEGFEEILHGVNLRAGGGKYTVGVCPDLCAGGQIAQDQLHACRQDQLADLRCFRQSQRLVCFHIDAAALDLTTGDVQLTGVKDVDIAGCAAAAVLDHATQHVKVALVDLYIAAGAGALAILDQTAVHLDGGIIVFQVHEGIVRSVHVLAVQLEAFKQLHGASAYKDHRVGGSALGVGAAVEIQLTAAPGMDGSTAVGGGIATGNDAVAHHIQGAVTYMDSLTGSGCDVMAV